MQPTDNDTDTLVDRREYLHIAGGIAAGAMAGLAGCAGGVPGSNDGSSDDGSASTGLLSTAVSDDPGDIGDFESCIVTLDGIWVGPKTDGEGDDEGDDEDDSTSADDDGATNETEQDDDSNGSPEQADGNGNSSSDDSSSGSQDETEDGNETDTGDGSETDTEDGEEGDEGEATEDGEGEDGDDDSSGGRTYYEFEELQEADLTQLQGDAQQLVGEHELEVGTYQFLQLDIGDIHGTLTDGSEASVDTPGNAPLKFNQSFEVREDYRTTFLADFTPVRRGNGSYLFKPVAAETEVSYEKIESDDTETADDGNTTESDGNATDDGNTTDSSGNTTDSE